MTFPDSFIIWNLVLGENLDLIFNSLESHHFTDQRSQKAFEIALTIKNEQTEFNTINWRGEIEKYDKTLIKEVIELSSEFYLKSSTDEKTVKSVIKKKRLDYFRNWAMLNINDFDPQEYSQRMSEIVGNDSVDLIDAQSAIDDYISKNSNLLPYFSRIIDRLIGGIRNELTIFAARPSVGKSLFLEHIFWHLSKLRKKVLFISSEMSQANVLDRQAIRLFDKELLRMTVSERAECIGKINDIQGSSLILDGSFTPTQIDNLVKTHKPEIVLVDYLGNLQLENKKITDEYARVTSISTQLARLRKEWNIPAIIACQLSREGRGRPQLHHLRSSGQIEQDADVVMLAWRDGDMASGDAKILINCDKNRFGRTFANGENYEIGFMRKKVSLFEIENLSDMVKQSEEVLV